MDTNSNSANNTGILLIGHGSRLPYGKQVISEIADKYRETTDITVEVGFMELAKPTIPTAFNKLAKTGVNKIIVTPVFLAHGVHTKRDIPTILGLPAQKIEAPPHNHNHEHHHHHDEEEETETIEFDGEIIYTEPLGADDKIVEIVTERISEHI